MGFISLTYTALPRGVSAPAPPAAAAAAAVISES